MQEGATEGDCWEGHCNPNGGKDSVNAPETNSLRPACSTVIHEKYSSSSSVQA